MLPVFLDLSRLRILLIGQGEVVRARMKKLKEAGAEHVVFYDRLISAEELLKADLVLIAGLEEKEARRIAETARSMGKLVNVEDDNAYCDFFYASFLRRGDLTLAVGTNGKSPTLAKLVRRHLEQVFDARWGAWLERIAYAREEWRHAGEDKETVGQKTEALIREEAMQPLAEMLQKEEA